MPTRIRKSRKYRGSRTCGYGKVGQHRDQGSKPYRKAGRHKHKWSFVLRYEPEYFGKSGFTSPRGLKQKNRIINVGKLDELANRFAVEKEKERPLIDLRSLGYTKLLGTGKVSKPLIIKVASSTESAIQKIKVAGGEVLMETQEEGE